MGLHQVAQVQVPAPPNVDLNPEGHFWYQISRAVLFQTKNFNGAGQGDGVPTKLFLLWASV
jgi:hypothetical protein